MGLGMTAAQRVEARFHSNLLDPMVMLGLALVPMVAFLALRLYNGCCCRCEPISSGPLRRPGGITTANVLGYVTGAGAGAWAAR
jgi:hypothetical protein